MPPLMSDAFYHRGVVLPFDDGVVFGAFLGGNAHLVALAALVLEVVGGEPGVHGAQHLVGGAVVDGRLVAYRWWYLGDSLGWRDQETYSAFL